MKITKTQLRKIIKEEILKEVSVPGMAGKRPKDMFGRVVLFRDLVATPTIKAGNPSVKHERVRFKGIIQKPDLEPESYPDGGLPGFRETGSPLLTPDQPVIVSLADGNKISNLANGEPLTLADLVSQREMMDLYKEWKNASPKERKTLEWPLFISRLSE